MSKSNGLAFLRKNRAIGYKLKYWYYFIFKRQRLQKKKCFGNLNKDKIIYIIKPDSEDSVEGLLSLLARSSLYIRYAQDHGYEACVDWKNYKTQYSSGTDNAWDYFFKQPSDISLDEAYKSKRVFLSGWTYNDINPNSAYDLKQFLDRRINEECHEILRNSIQFSDEVLCITEKEGKRIDISNCLGLYVRGTDYVKLKPSGEYIQPNVEMVIEKVEEFLIKYPGINIYLVTEDGEIYKRLVSKFGKLIVLVSFDSFIYEYSGETYLSKSNVLNENKIKRGIDYLVKMILLSQCKYLISSITMGSMFSYGLNSNRYEDEYIFNLGLYP